MTYPPAVPQPQQQPQAPPSAKAGGIAIGALVVGIVAFLLGLVPVLGLLLAIVGIVLGILALRGRAGRGLGITGLILSAFAFLTNIAVIVVLAVIPWGSIGNAIEEGATDAIEDQYGVPDDSLPDFETQSVDTPCYYFEGPAGFINDLSDDDVENCFTELELWGEMDADGTIANTGVGAVHGSVYVEPIRSSTTAEWAPNGTVDEMVESMSTGYIAEFGTPISLREPVALDGAEGNLTRVESDSESTQTKALIVLKAPQEYQTYGEPAQFFLITFVTPYDNGEELIQTTIDSWDWN